MMKLLVVYCHPVPTSYNAAIFEVAKQALAGAGHELRIIDLYAENFQAIMTRKEREDYLDHTETLIDSVPEHVDALRWAEGMVFIFPTWMNGPPAMLKGWLERTWLPGVTFAPATEKGHRPSNLLKNIRRLVVITTSGSPAWWMYIIRNPTKFMFVRGLRGLFGMRCKTIWLQQYNMNCTSDEDRKKFLEKVRHKLAKI